jgi:hypothetical protein
MASNVDSRTLRAALEGEIEVVVRVRDTLRTDSHLRTLCDLAADRLAELLLYAGPAADAGWGDPALGHRPDRP